MQIICYILLLLITSILISLGDLNVTEIEQSTTSSTNETTTFLSSPSTSFFDVISTTDLWSSDAPPSTFPSEVKNPNSDNSNYLIYGIRVLNRDEDEKEPLVLKIDTDYFHVIGKHLVNIQKAWLTTLGHCISQDLDSTCINVTLEEFTGSTEFARNFSAVISESGDEVYNFCGYTSDAILDDDPWRPYVKIIKILDPDNMYLPMYIQIPLIIFLALLSALFSGLNVGLMSLSVSALELIVKHEPIKSLREQAENILPLRKNGNLLLCTILIGNTFVNNALTLLISNLIEETTNFNKLILFLISVVLPAAIIVFIGEIVPQAIGCRYGLFIGSKTRYITIFFIVVTFVISYPLSKILDWVVGVEGTESYDTASLALIIEMNVDQGGLTKNMADMARRALEGFNKTAKDVMTPIDKVYMLPDSCIIDNRLIQEIYENGHTRIPIYRTNDSNIFVGILNVKDLVPVDQKYELTIGTVIDIWKRSKHFRFVTEDLPIPQLLREMKRGHSLAFVCRYNQVQKAYDTVGIIALEDIIEEITGEILDEKDVKIPLQRPSTKYCAENNLDEKLARKSAPSKTKYSIKPKTQ